MGAYLTPWRWTAAMGLLLIVGAPLLLPVIELATHGSRVWMAQEEKKDDKTEDQKDERKAANERFRLGQLYQHTFLLVAGTLALALPVGIGLAILLFRTEFPGRQFLLGCTFI